jgi:hypothetical protein
MSNLKPNTFDLDSIVSKLVNDRSSSVDKTSLLDKTSNEIQSFEPANDTNVLEYDRILNSYTEIPRLQWGSIPLQTYIRYKNTDGELKLGGRLISLMPVGNNYILTINSRNRISGYKNLTWSVNTEKISNIYRYNKARDKVNKIDSTTANVQKKTHHEELMSQLGDKLLFDDSESIKNRLDSFEVRLQKLENDLKKLFMLFKRMYEKSIK